MSTITQDAPTVHDRGSERQRPRFSIDVERAGNAAVARVSGTLTAAGREQLAELLDWLIQDGVRQLRVQLGTAEQIDPALLQLLRAARARLDGALLVTADRPEQRPPLAMAGLSQPSTGR